jgi:hypothetical protein
MLQEVLLLFLEWQSDHLLHLRTVGRDVVAVPALVSSSGIKKPSESLIQCPRTIEAFPGHRLLAASLRDRCEQCLIRDSLMITSQSPVSS